MSTPTELPILMSAPMVLATLRDVDPKTQTRRALRLQPPADCGDILCGPFHPTVTRRGEEEPGPAVFGAYTEDGTWALKCPFGGPGTMLWVREAWCKSCGHDDDDTVCLAYRASQQRTDDGPLSGSSMLVDNIPRPLTVDLSAWREDERWRPSIHMPRWASRITLGVTDVRVQRLASISEEDAIAEGCAADNRLLGDDDVAVYEAMRTGLSAPVARYAVLWTSINGPGSWQANPHVWAITFKRIKP